MDDWNNPDLLLKQEKEIMKDPYKTVFIARLPYLVTEIEISKQFSRFGPILSVRIIRDRNNKPRGYGFVVYEKESDAKTCVRELAATGLKLEPGSRSILVDIERSRIVRNWLPRRLGGGLGGRHYTSSRNNASAAALGRRLNLPINAYEKRPRSYHGPAASATATPTAGPSASTSSTTANTKKDMYAKYSQYMPGTQRSSHDIRRR